MFTFKPNNFALTVVLALAAASAAYATCPATSCRFSFCPTTYMPISLGGSDVPLTNAICDPTGAIYIGDVDSTGQAYIKTSYGYTLISQYSPPGLAQPFTPSFWKSYSFYQYGKLFSGVGHEVPQQNQASFLSDQCFVLPLTAYQVLDAPYGNVIRNVHPTDPFVDCVAFST